MRWQLHAGDRKAFRLCIDEDDRDRLLNDTKWPESIVNSDWYRLDPSTRRQQPTERTSYSHSSESQSNQVSADIEITPMASSVNPDVTLIDGDATVIYQPVGTTEHADNSITSDHGVQ